MNRVILLENGWWVKGVKISCSGDMKILGKAAFRDVYVRRSQKEGHQDPESTRKLLDHMVSGRNVPQFVCQVSAHMGFTLLVSKCDFEEEVLEAFHSGKMQSPFDNIKVQELMMNANPAEENQSWGWTDIDRWCRGNEPTVLVVRKDGKPITAKQVEVFIAYISEVLQWAMKPDENDYEYDEMQKKFANNEITIDELMEFEDKNTEENRRKGIIEKYMKSGRFEKFIEMFMKEKLAEGDTTWANVTSPRAD
ncbi:hypothetical protein ONS95_004345 [Cadophora gregata]|uniref:uncharacterized protein n=1 Tax=Cadophora gregata TaxID=51156 RepID=UPI0026DD6031|nr:uncharacterized protein ONS95_004345 [Cadophora gregata]KAK0105269.1 hypothetical protein ONS96_004666 [Cadophora gregata f. sp. sojae]KAK0105830.1 hypothetical protein ONS95_004345 [Cadophora gregata]